MIVETENLRKRFGNLEVIQGMTLKVPEGGAFALVGENGAGKTTTIKILMNILRPTAGSAKVLGVDTRALGPAQFAQIGYVSESQEMPGGMTVSAYINYLRPFYPTWDGQLEAELLNRFCLPHDRRIRNLSHGMRLKMSLACAMAFRPKLLVLDEPFSGLDPLTRDELLEGLMRRDDDTTILISSHELAEIEDMTTHVAFVSRGKLLFQEEASVLKARFRAVRVTTRGTAAVPSGLPPNWLSVNAADNDLSFIDKNYSAAELAAQVERLFGSVVTIDARPIPIRTIYTTLAREVRTGAENA